jgi:hypothetical protein
METYREIGSCRACGKRELKPVFSLGEQYVINFSENMESKEAYKTPLELVMCDAQKGGCGLLQLKHTFNRELLYREYWYRSGINALMIQNLKNIVDEAVKTAKLEKGDVVLDIGSNDGTLLRQYADKNITRFGFEPSNLADMAGNGISTINDFFNYASYKTKVGKPAKIITSIAMFYDLDDPNQFVDDIKHALDPEGVWIIQMNYLGLMIKNKTFDNILAEHLEYYSLASLENLLNRHELEIFDVETNDVNGGSVRTYIRHRGSRISRTNGIDRVREMQNLERSMRLNDKETYIRFGQDLQELKRKVTKFVEEEKAKGRIFYLEGASTRGLVQMQFFGFTNKEFQYAIEKDPRKWGKFYAETNIKIISPEGFYKLDGNRLASGSPAYLYVLPYHFLPSIIKDRKEYMEAGGKLFVVIPEFKIIESGNTG